MKKIYLFTVISLKTLFASAQLYTPGGGVTDIDGNAYQTIVINGQEWMAENLKTSKYANGVDIPNVTSSSWPNLTSGAWCYYNNDTNNNDTLGKLYNWHTISDQRKVCPVGWHIPAEIEWKNLSAYLGGPFDLVAESGNSISGGKMKSMGNLQDGTGLWESPNSNATNESGFNGVPTGYRNDGGGGFYNKGTRGYWWSSTPFISPIGSTAAQIFNLFSYSGKFVEEFIGKNCGLAIRCVKDNSSDIIEINQTIKSVIKVFDIQGKETDIKSNELLFFLYSDGSIEKKMIVE